MSDKGIIESFLDSLSLWAAVQDSKDARGKPDPHKAAGIAWGMNGDLSTADILELGGYLGAEGAFDESPTNQNAPYICTSSVLSPKQERKSMNWYELSEVEKQRRIAKANRTKTWYRYWNATWQYEELKEKLSPLETADLVWKKVSAAHAKWPQQHPDYREKFIGWLRKNHDIRMDTEDKMHLIKRKKR